MRPVNVRPKDQTFALTAQFIILGFLSNEAFRFYRGTHPAISRLEEAGIWPPPKLSLDDKKDKAEQDEGAWMNLNGVPIPSSFESWTGFWRR